MEMTVEREKMKALAVETLKKLDVYAPYIRKFAAKKSTVTLFERFGGYYIDGLSDNTASPCCSIRETHTSNTRSRMYGIKLAIIAASPATLRLPTITAAWRALPNEVNL